MKTAAQIVPTASAPLMDRETLMASARDASEFLKALSHETRLLILCMLMEGEKSVSELEEMLDLRQPAVSQQLARLRADNLVETRRDGKNVYYTLARPEVIEVIGALHKAFCGPGAAPSAHSREGGNPVRAR